MTITGPCAGNISDMTIEITSSGLFDAASDITHIADGTVTLTFDACNSGTVAYDVPSINQHGIIPIQRGSRDNIALCEALQAGE